MNDLSSSELSFIISRLIENANDASQEENDDDFIRGKKLAYYEMLDTIKNELTVRDIDLSKYGLDFEPEKFL